MRIKTIVLLLGIGLISLATILTAVGATAVQAALIEYPLPGSAAPQCLATESPGRIWFTLPESNAIGRLVVTSPANYQFTIYPLPASASEPYDIAFAGPYVWFSERAGNRIGRFHPTTNSFKEFTLPTPNSMPTGIAVAPNGSLWFTEQHSNQIGHLTADMVTYTAYPYPQANAQLSDIAIFDNNAIWFAAPGVKSVVRLKPSVPSFSNVPLQLFPGGATFAPGGLALDGDFPWVTAPTVGLVGRYAPGTLAFWIWYSPPVANGGPTALAYKTVMGQSHIWLIKPQTNQVARLVTDANGQLRSFWQRPLPTANSQPTDIVVDTAGTAWVAARGAGKIVSWSPPYFDSTYLPLIQKP